MLCAWQSRYMGFFLNLALCSVRTLPAALSAFAVSCCCQCFSNTKAAFRLKLGGKAGGGFLNLPESRCNQGTVLLSSRRYPGQSCPLVVPTQGVTPHTMLCSLASCTVCSSPRVGMGDQCGLPPRVGFECFRLFNINSQKQIFHLFLSCFQQSRLAA